MSEAWGHGMVKVLLIDDEPAVQEVYRQMLQAGGHQPIVARTGSDLLDDLKTLEYDIVVTDLHMPVIDGWDVASWLAERRPGIPIIAAAGNVSSGRNAPMTPFQAVLQKPFRRAELLSAIERVMRRGQEPRP